MKNLEKQFEMGFQSNISLSMDNGKIEIWGWDSPICKITAESESSINFEFHQRQDYLQMELSKGSAKQVQLYVPKHSKLLVDGSYVDVNLANFQGSTTMELGKGDIKISNLDGQGIIESEKGNLEIENTKGKLYVEKGKGDIKGFNIDGTVKIESGKGNMELIALSGECDIENGHGDIVLKDSKGNLNLYCGKGDLTLDFCRFKRLAAEGKGETNVNISSDQQGVWNISRKGNYAITAPVAAQLDFKIECSTIKNSIPGLNFSKFDDIYKGTIGFSPKGTIYIEDAKEVSFAKGTSQGTIDIETIDQDEKETLKILEMLKQGIITSDQADELLSAIEGTLELEEV